MKIGLLVIASAVVIASFLGVTAISQSKTRAIDHLAAEISETSAPKIEALTTARGELHQASQLIQGAFKTGSSNNERAMLGGVDHRLREALDSYRSFPLLPGEQILERDAVTAPSAYLDLGVRIVDRLEARDVAGAQRLTDQLEITLERADQSIERLVQLNSDHARLIGLEIRQARHHATTLSRVLHALAALLALLVTFVLARVLRSASRTADERLQLELDRKRLAEERAHEMELFAARIAHDLKNPLAAVILNLGMAQPRCAGEAQARVIRATRGVRRTLTIIDEILQLTRAGQADPDAHTSLRDAIDAVVSDCIADAESVGARLAVAPFGDVEVACSEGPLFSVIGNLLRNSIKYIAHSQSGDRHIELRVGVDGGRAHVEIEDNGPGLTPGEEGRVFELFVRGKHFGEPGLGLGLATVQRIVSVHGGEVGVRSRPGEGCCFWFELPLHNPELAPVVTH